MSVKAYEKHMSELQPHLDKYRREIPSDTGIATPASYTVGPDPGPPYILKATAGQPGTAPISINPAASLYSSGQQNQVLLSASANTCNTGCLSGIQKPDPRLAGQVIGYVKPLYTATVFSGKDLPTVYNVVGMY